MILFANEPLLQWTEGHLIDLSDGNVAVEIKQGEFLSVQPNGSYETRTIIGGWETAKKVGNKLVYKVEGKTFVVPLVEGL